MAAGRYLLNHNLADNCIRTVLDRPKATREAGQRGAGLGPRLEVAIPRPIRDDPGERGRQRSGCVDVRQPSHLQGDRPLRDSEPSGPQRRRKAGLQVSNRHKSCEVCTLGMD